MYFCPLHHLTDDGDNSILIGKTSSQKFPGRLFHFFQNVFHLENHFNMFRVQVLTAFKFIQLLFKPPDMLLYTLIFPFHKIITARPQDTGRTARTADKPRANSFKSPCFTTNQNPGFP